jgi:hypothetical protein
MRTNVIETRQVRVKKPRLQMDRWFSKFAMAFVIMGVGFATACTLPQAPPTEEMSPAEAAAFREWQLIQRAEAQGSRPARARYEKVLENYPQTATAYEVNLVLAKQDHRSIEAQKRTSSSMGPAADSSHAFYRRYAQGSYTTPPTQQLQARYRTELNPLIYDAVKTAGSWQILIEYLKAYPTAAEAPLAEQEMERRISNIEAGWEAKDMLREYVAIRPDRVKSQRLEAHVEENLFRRVSERGSFEEAKRFLDEYPNSRFKDHVNAIMRRGRL